MTISKIWINDGCISCHKCEADCPDVFHITDDGDCIISANLVINGIASNNRNEKTILKSALNHQLETKIIATAANCPIRIIEIELEKHEATSKTPSQIKHAVARSSLPLPSLQLYLAAQTNDQTEGITNPIANLAINSKTNDIIVPTPTIATDSDLIKLQMLLGHKIEEIFQQAGEMTCQVAKENILEALAACRNDSSLGYEMLADQTATHYPTAKNFSFSVVYHLTSIRRSKRLRLRILIPEGFEPDSAVTLYPAANWMEREIWDMLGIRFKNHPNMTRILCPEDWEGHALRKDYPVEGLGQRNLDFREDRSGILMRMAIEKANNIKINADSPKGE